MRVKARSASPGLGRTNSIHQVAPTSNHTSTWARFCSVVMERVPADNEIERWCASAALLGNQNLDGANIGGLDMAIAVLIVQSDGTKAIPAASSHQVR